MPMTPEGGHLDALLDTVTSIVLAAMFFVLGLLVSMWFFNPGVSALLGQAAVQILLEVVALRGAARKKISKILTYGPCVHGRYNTH